MATYLITGAGRGIGFELVKQLLDLPASKVAKIITVTRNNSSSGLSKIIGESQGRVQNVIVEEITNDKSVEKAVPEIEAALQGFKGLDCLINNVGVLPVTPEGTKGMSSAHLTEVFNVNVVSAHNMITKLLPLLQKGQEKKVINVSTTMGSIAYTRNYKFAPTPAYKITKAAMNMLTAQYAMDLEEEGFTVFAVSPGWLKTDMGSQNADLDVTTGVEAVVEVILNSDNSMNGKFQNIKVKGWEAVSGPNRYDGAGVPW